MSQNFNNEISNNTKPYGLIDAPSASAFFSLLSKLEADEINQEIEIYPIEFCETCKDFTCVCDQIFSQCPTLHCKNRYNIYEAEECEDCLCSKISVCYCGNKFSIYEKYGMCFDCEMKERKQESIDRILYPDDVDRYISDSD